MNRWGTSTSASGSSKRVLRERYTFRRARLNEAASTSGSANAAIQRPCGTGKRVSAR